MKQFLKEKLDVYEKSSKPSNDMVHEAQMLLKEIFDLEDQGYLHSYNTLNNSVDAVKRLSNFIINNNGKIIKPLKKSNKEKVLYNDEMVELNDYIANLESSIAENSLGQSGNKLIKDVFEYSKWLYKSLDKNVAYIFLLRDTFLPYLAFKWWCKDKNIIVEPWLIGRKWLALFPSKKSLDNNEINNCAQNFNFGDNDEVYDMIYEGLFTSLDKENDDFEKFSALFSDFIAKRLSDFPKIEQELKLLLNKIKQPKIMVVESGRFASIPMLMHALDKRVDFRLFTTTPQFYGVYKGKFFSNEYDKNRLFETLQCQDVLFQFAGFQNEKFYVKETKNKSVKENALMELNKWKNLCLKNK